VVSDVSKGSDTCIFKVQAFQEDRIKVLKGISFLDCLTVEVEGTVFL
jgi:hypothetical protein